MCRGYYTRTVLAAWDWRDGKLTRRWTFDSDDGTASNRAYRGQGNHSLSVADVDGDGKDEIVYGAMAIDDDGKGLYSTGLGHGDALHVSRSRPDRPGPGGLRHPGAVRRRRCARSATHDRRGALEQGLVKARADGRAPGAASRSTSTRATPAPRCWAAAPACAASGTRRASRSPSSSRRACNFGVWWDGDLLRELLDGNDDRQVELDAERPRRRCFVADGCASNNGTKATPALCADILGDWREEVIWRDDRRQASCASTPRRSRPSTASTP